jgi:prophage antirepressor-like protein
LKGAKSKDCKNIYELIQYDSIDEDGGNIIDVENQILQFDGHKFSALFIEKDNDDWDIWIRASEAARYLGYGNERQVIREYVDDDNKMTVLKLIELFPRLSDSLPKSIDKKTIYINISGFMNLVHQSTKKIAKNIKRWLDNEVVPALIKYGTYNMQPKDFQIKLFYDDNNFASYDKKRVLYIAYVGKYKCEHIFKFGISADMFSREYIKHRKQFEKFDLVLLVECDNNVNVEKLFKKEIKLRNLNRQCTIRGKNQTELFTITAKHTHEYFIEFMQKLVIEHKLPAIKDAEKQIVTLNNVVGMYQNQIDITKLDKEIQQKMCDFKNSDNYKLELETQVKLAEIQFNAKDKDIELEKLRIQRIALEKDIFVEIPNSIVPKRDISKRGPRNNSIKL